MILKRMSKIKKKMQINSMKLWFSLIKLKINNPWSKSKFIQWEISQIKEYSKNRIAIILYLFENFYK